MKVQGLFQLLRTRFFVPAAHRRPLGVAVLALLYWLFVVALWGAASINFLSALGVLQSTATPRISSTMVAVAGVLFLITGGLCATLGYGL